MGENVLAGDVAAVKTRNAAHDREAESRPPRFSRPGGIDAVETLEDPGNVLRRDANAAVFDYQSDQAGRVGCREGERDVRRTRVTLRVLDEIGKRLFDQLRIAGRENLL